LVLSFLFPWLVVGFVCWLGYQLVRQNGRLLLRLEAIEQRLTQLGRPAHDPAPSPSIPSGLPRGSAAPDFELPELTGGSKKLSHFRGKRILLVFFNPSCGFCLQMAPELAALPWNEKSRPMPLVITTGDVEINRQFVKEHGIHCPVLIQSQMEVAAKYQVSGTPIGYLIDEQGKIASELATGSEKLLSLATSAEQNARGNGHALVKGNRPLSESRIARDGLKAGTPAPGFRLPRVDGGELSLEEYWGRRVILVFSAPDCSPCNELAPKLEELHRNRPEITVLMVSRGDLELNRAKLKEHGITFPVVLQRQWEISRLYGMFATPIAYLINEQGIIAADVAVGVNPILALFSSVSPIQSEKPSLDTQGVMKTA
jgi:peroxiredoxin